MPCDFELPVTTGQSDTQTRRPVAGAAGRRAIVSIAAFVIGRCGRGEISLTDGGSLAKIKLKIYSLIDSIVKRTEPGFGIILQLSWHPWSTHQKIRQ